MRNYGYYSGEIGKLNSLQNVIPNHVLQKHRPQFYQVCNIIDENFAGIGGIIGPILNSNLFPYKTSPLLPRVSYFYLLREYKIKHVNIH